MSSASLAIYWRMMSRRGIARLLLAVLALAMSWPSAGRDPESLARAQAAFQQGDWPRAERECELALKEQPDNPRAYKLLGMVFVAQQRFENATAPLPANRRGTFPSPA